MTLLRQDSKNPIEWTWAYGGRWVGMTAKTRSGCPYQCTWEIDGETVGCYAKRIAESARVSKFYPHGYEHVYLSEDVFDEIQRRQKPSAFFVDAMGDLFAPDTPSEYIYRLLDLATETPEHIFMSLTKNPRRLVEFREQFPVNWWVGTSTQPSAMGNKHFSQEDRKLKLGAALAYLEATGAAVRFLSAEPLVDDIADSLIEQPGAINWLILGAGSTGRKKHQPDPDHVCNAVYAATIRDIAIFCKGNLRGNPGLDGKWYEEFPDPSVMGQWYVDLHNDLVPYDGWRK